MRTNMAVQQLQSLVDSVSKDEQKSEIYQATHASWDSHQHRMGLRDVLRAPTHDSATGEAVGVACQHCSMIMTQPHSRTSMDMPTFYPY